MAIPIMPAGNARDRRLPEERDTPEPQPHKDGRYPGFVLGKEVVGENWKQMHPAFAIHADVAKANPEAAKSLQKVAATIERMRLTAAMKGGKVHFYDNRVAPLCGDAGFVIVVNGQELPETRESLVMY